VAVANQTEQKVMVRREAHHDLGREVQALGDQLTEWLTENKRVTRTAAQGAMDKVLQLQARVTEYERLVEGSLGDLQERTRQAKLLLIKVFSDKLDA
jgi:hypothetical protein